jgi:hypothetical protein
MKSGAVMWYAPAGEAEPDETTIDFGDAWGGNWARVGFTKAALVFAYEDERAEIMVEEHLGPLDEWRISEHARFETTLAELEADYLALMTEGTVTNTAAGASQDGYEELPVGGTALLTKRAWGIEGLHVNAAGESQPMRLFIARGTAKLNGTLEFSKKTDDYTGMPILIQSLADNANSGRMFKFQRVTAEKTS